MSELVVAREDNNNHVSPDEYKNRHADRIRNIRGVLEAKPKKEKPRNFYSVDVVNRGEQIIIPEGMSHDQAIEWITRKKEEETQMQRFKYRIDCSPLDGLVAVKRAADRTFGYTSISSGSGSPLFGEDPPRMIKVETGYGQHELVPLDRLKPPALGDGYISMEFEQVDKGATRFSITGQAMKKHLKMIDDFVELVKDIVRYESIYRGKCISISRLTNQASDIEEAAPKFLNMQIEDENLILNRDTETSLKTSVFMRLEYTQECLENNVPLKHGVLLAGPYGTGKTLSAKVISRKAYENGWTFIYLEDSRELPEALRFAEMYAPAVLFSEDIDKAVKGERDSRMDQILNTLDGIDTKDHSVITVLTTNHPEQINSGFLRAGRIDTVIPVEYPDKETIARFIDFYARNERGDSILEEGTNLEDSCNSLEGFPPAFIAEVINKAKMHAFYRNRRWDGMTGDDIVVTAKSLKAHQQLMDKNHKKLDPTTGELLEKAIGDIVNLRVNTTIPVMLNSQEESIVDRITDFIAER